MFTNCYTHLLKGIALGLKLKLGEPGRDLFPEIESIQDVSLLEDILEGIDTASTVSQLRQIYHLHTTNTQSSCLICFTLVI